VLILGGEGHRVPEHGGRAEAHGRRRPPLLGPRGASGAQGLNRRDVLPPDEADVGELACIARPSPFGIWTWKSPRPVPLASISLTLRSISRLEPDVICGPCSESEQDRLVCLRRGGVGEALRILPVHPESALEVDLAGAVAEL
jgi:hypothetical protein